MSKEPWYRINIESQIITPGLLVFPDRVKHNIESMIQISGDPNRLIPHVKTYKMQNIVKLLMSYGIKEFKCATLGEMQMLISCNVKHILLAIQPTKEKALKVLKVQEIYPEITFSTLVDNSDSLKLFSNLAKSKNQKMNLWLDINNGMNRTGVVPKIATGLYMKLFNDSNLKAEGLHVYDGHIRSQKMKERVDQCNIDFESVERLIFEIENHGGIVPKKITGGSPSFYPHSLKNNNLLSPGTTLLWDLGYQRIWKDSPFLQAAILVTRLISKPNKNIFCFDLGHKSVASEMPLPRVEILGLEGANHKMQSEEHLVLEYEKENNFKIGDLFYAIPYHICPTVAKYSKAYAVIGGEIDSFWKIEAQNY
ncbi:MAG: threonine aldolase [Flavobacteriaceae bacterium]|nr:threonine aldolase [Flavobacteriaceae bacterium]